MVLNLSPGHQVKHIVTPVSSNYGNSNQSYVNVNYYHSENTTDSMSTYILGDHKEGESMISFKSKCQPVSKFTETTIKKEETDGYDELLRLWNITANKGEVKVRIDKLKDDIKMESSFNKLDYYHNGKSYNELSPIASSASEDKSINIINNSSTDNMERGKFSQDIVCDESLFCNEVKFGIVYTCCFCENVFSSKHSLAKHKRKHNFCQYCKAKFKSMKALNNHRKNCVFKICMTSHPRVKLSDIGLSRKIRSLYGSAFSRDKFPVIGNALKCNIKKELVECNTHYLNDGVNTQRECVYSPSSNSVNSIVKFEPIEYEESTEEFCKNNNHSIFYDTAENFVKLEAVDIVEDQFMKDNGTLHSPIKEEVFLDYPPEISIITSSESAMHSDFNSSNKVNTMALPMNIEIDVLPLPVKVIERKENVEGKIEENETYLSKDESCREPRFSCSKSELKKDILSPPEVEYKYAYEFVRDDDNNVIKNPFQDNLSSKENSNDVETLISNIITVQTEIQKIKEDQSKVVSNIPSAKIDLKLSENVLKSKLETSTSDSKLVPLEKRPIEDECECSSIQAVEKNMILQSIKPEIKVDPETHSVSSKILKSSRNHIISHGGKSSYSQRVKYIRFTNTPNLNLFMF